jgi:hypothetical protein
MFVIRCSDFRYRILSIKYQEPNIKHRESNIKYQEPNIEHQESNIKYQEPNIKHRESNIKLILSHNYDIHRCVYPSVSQTIVSADASGKVFSLEYQNQKANPYEQCGLASLVDAYP